MPEHDIGGGDVAVDDPYVPRRSRVLAQPGLDLVIAFEMARLVARVLFRIALELAGPAIDLALQEIVGLAEGFQPDGLVIDIGRWISPPTMA
jgi:hypothetical protein